ncbi:MAG: alpha-ribazole phosphatase family protein [Rhodocyclaceae bacterium]|nr:alpha-ribazole phosphatase family protein [Rhodocyclaceae bacterium]
MKIFLIRHPRPEVPDGTCYGRTDLGLAEDPVACADRLRGLVPAGLPVWSSPLSRCLRLAEALHPAPRIDPRLVEADFGAWEMSPWKAIGRQAIDGWAADPLHFAAHGGESVAELHARVAAFLGDLEADAVVVAHAGVMKVALGELLGLPPREWLGLQFGFGTATALEGSASGGFRLLWQNRNS